MIKLLLIKRNMLYIGMIFALLFLNGTIFNIENGDLLTYGTNLSEYISILLQNFTIMTISFSSALVVIFGFIIIKKFI